MSGFLIFLVVLAVIIAGLRYLRRREVEAFMQGDTSLFEEIAQKYPDAPTVKSISSQTVVPDLANTGIPDVAGPASMPADLMPVQLKRFLFDDVHRAFDSALQKVVADRYRIFIHLPLKDLVTTEDKTMSSRLRVKTVAFALADRDSLALVCAICLKGTSNTESRETAFLEEVFAAINVPLYQFPVLTAYATLEIEEVLAEHLAGGVGLRNCPKCGQDMTMRRAVKGRNNGKSFWVCTEYPSCKGIMSI